MKLLNSKSELLKGRKVFVKFFNDYSYFFNVDNIPESRYLKARFEKFDRLEILYNIYVVIFEYYINETF